MPEEESQASVDSLDDILGRHDQGEHEEEH